MKEITITRGATSFTFDRSTFRTAPGGAYIQTLSGFHSPTMDTPKSRLPKGGSYVFSTQSVERVLGWSGKLVGTTRNNWLEMRRKILGILIPNTLVDDDVLLIEFETDDGLTLQFDAKVNNLIDLPDEPQWFRHCPYTIELVVANSDSTPWFYDQTQQEITVARNDSNTCPNFTAVNGGVNVAPQYKIFGPGTDFTVTNSTTSESLVINTTLTAGQHILVDVGQRTVKRDNGDNLYGSFTGDWAELVTGDNTVALAIASGDTAATEMDVIYRKGIKGI